MTEAAFAAYLSRSIPEYAEEKVRAGSWHPDDALRMSQEGHDKFLPEGMATPGHFLFELVEVSTNHVVGNLWLFINDKAHPPRSWIYDIAIEERHQRRGLGRAALKLAENEMRRRGSTLMELHVFGWNARAVSLYEKSGYEYVDMVMSKPLG